MAITIKNEEVEQLVREVARRKSEKGAVRACDHYFD